jgi:hypothetical protein
VNNAQNRQRLRNVTAKRAQIHTSVHMVNKVNVNSVRYDVVASEEMLGNKLSVKC